MGGWLLDAIPEVAITLFGIEIRWYALCILTGALLAMFVSQRIIRSYGYGKEIIGDMFLYAFIGGLVGARLWYIIANIHEFINAGNIFDIIGSMLAVWNGGLAVQGGVILGAICGFWFLYKNYPDKKKFPKGLIADAIIPNILIAQVLGRWGNFFNQEVYGSVVTSKAWQWFPFAVYLDNGTWHYALFFYEFVLNVAIFIGLYFMLKRTKTAGYVSGTYLVCYGTIRFILEPLRETTYNLMIGGLKLSSIISLLSIIIGITIIVLIYTKSKRGQQIDKR